MQTKTQTTGNPILDALLNASESFADTTADAGQNRELTTEHDCPECGEHFSTCICEEAQGKPELPEHSPLPWHLSHEYGDGFNIAHEIAPNCGKLSVIANVQYSDVKYQPTREQAKANAKLIVASVNHADKLAEALRELADECQLARKYIVLDDDNGLAAYHATAKAWNQAKQTLDAYEAAQ